MPTLNAASSPKARPNSYWSGLWQGTLHLAAIYCIARICTPWLLQTAHDRIVPLMTGRPARIGFQFFFAHQFAFSFVPGLLAGFLNAKLLHNGIARFVWAMPVLVLVFLFMFTTPGRYPTMIFQSDFGEAFRWFFGGDHTLPEYASYAELWNDTPKVIVTLVMFRQFRFLVPVYVGLGYSVGAWLSPYFGRLNLSSAQVEDVMSAKNPTE